MTGSDLTTKSKWKQWLSLLLLVLFIVSLFYVVIMKFSVLLSN